MAATTTAATTQTITQVIENGKQVKSLVLSELVSGSKCIAIFKEKYSNELTRFVENTGYNQNFLGRNHIANVVLNQFNSLAPNDFVSWLDKQQGMKGNLNGSNIAETIQRIAKQTKVK